jgi:hypothetical protein
VLFSREGKEIYSATCAQGELELPQYAKEAAIVVERLMREAR